MLLFLSLTPFASAFSQCRESIASRAQVPSGDADPARSNARACLATKVDAFRFCRVETAVERARDPCRRHLASRKRLQPPHLCFGPPALPRAFSFSLGYSCGLTLPKTADASSNRAFRRWRFARSPPPSHHQGSWPVATRDGSGRRLAMCPRHCRATRRSTN